MPSGRLLVLVAMLAVLGPATVGAVRQLAADDPSPAGGHAQVIAHGVALMPEPEVAWRVVLDTAEPLAQAAVEERALGFAVADRSALVVNDRGFGIQQRVAAGEAVFVPGGARQQRASLDGTPAPYYRLALVPAWAAAEAGGDQLIFAGNPFPAPVGGGFDLDLVRDVLTPNEESNLPATGSPTLVLATAGTIEVEADGGAPVRLAAGQAAAFAGNLAIFGVGDRSASFVAALIGPEVPPPPAPPTGSITIHVRGCPAGISPVAAVEVGFDPAVLGACGPLPLDPAPVLILATGEPLAAGQVDPDRAAYVWTGLLYSPFPVGEPAMPAGYAAYLLVDAAGNVVASNNGSGVQPTVASPGVLTVGAEMPDVAATLYLFPPPGGSISLAPFSCPAGMTRDNLVGESCEPASGNFVVEITSVEAGTIFDFGDATGPSGPYYTWSGLPIGVYAVRFSQLPSGYDDYVIPGAEVADEGGAYTLTLAPDAPDAQLNVFFLQAAATQTGSVTVTVYSCPSGMTRDTLTGDACQAASGFDLALYAPDGSVYRLSDATVQGNVVTWANLPFADYVVEETFLPPPYTDAYAPGVPTVTTAAAAYLVAITAAAPDAGLALYNLQPAAAPTLDSDGDGLSDAAEAELGTDPNNPDTDGDGRADGDEVGPRRVVTDPLNPDTDGDGIDDGDELAVGTDPNDATSR